MSAIPQGLLRRAAAAVALAASLGACAPNYTPVASETIDSSYSVTGFYYTGGGGRVWVFAKTEESAGMTRVCGAFSMDGLHVMAERDIWHTLSEAVLYHGDTRLLHGINFMNEILDHEQAAGRSSKCVDTDVPWQKSFAERGVYLKI